MREEFDGSPCYRRQRLTCAHARAAGLAGSAREGRRGVVVTFLAVMELLKEALVEIVQTEDFGPIHVKARAE